MNQNLEILTVEGGRQCTNNGSLVELIQTIFSETSWSILQGELTIFVTHNRVLMDMAVPTRVSFVPQRVSCIDGHGSAYPG